MESNQRITIRRISVTSAFKMGLVWSSITFAFFGFLGLLFSGVIASFTLGASLGSDEVGSVLGMFGGGFVIQMVLYVVGIIFYGILGGIVTAISAIFYNIVARIGGAIEIDI